MTEHNGDIKPTIKAYKGKSSSGIGGLDLALDGGFAPGTSVLVIGSATSGIDRFARQFWGISSESRRYFMIDGFVERGMTEGKALSPETIFNDFGGVGFVIDSLSTLIVKYGIESVLNGVISCRTVIHTSKDHAFYLLYKGLHDRYDEILLLRICDVVIELHEEVHGNELLRALEVKKITGMQPPGRVLPFLVTEKGIELSTTSRVV
ncbi:MAG TPA: hypothetical protein VN372_12785 [Methanospirillum sp.]|nr:hypothetical protein [Methanospirillum sp.]